MIDLHSPIIRANLQSAVTHCRMIDHGSPENGVMLIFSERS